MHASWDGISENTEPRMIKLVSRHIPLREKAQPSSFSNYFLVAKKGIFENTT